MNSLARYYRYWKTEQKSITGGLGRAEGRLEVIGRGKSQIGSPSCFKSGVCSSTLTGSSAISRFMKLFIEKLNTEKAIKNSHHPLSEIRLKLIDHCQNLFP